MQNGSGLDYFDLLNGRGDIGTVSIPIGDGNITMPVFSQSKTPGEIFNEAWKKEHLGDRTVMDGVGVCFDD